MNGGVTMNDIQLLRSYTGLSQSKFSEYMGIPVSTIRQWERDGARPPKYIPEMIRRIMVLEGVIKDN